MKRTHALKKTLMEKVLCAVEMAKSSPRMKLKKTCLFYAHCTRDLLRCEVEREMEQYTQHTQKEPTVFYLNFKMNLAKKVSIEL